MLWMHDMHLGVHNGGDGDVDADAPGATAVAADSDGADVDIEGDVGVEAEVVSTSSGMDSDDSDATLVDDTTITIAAAATGTEHNGPLGALPTGGVSTTTITRPLYLGGDSLPLSLASSSHHHHPYLPPSTMYSPKTKAKAKSRAKARLPFAVDLLQITPDTTPDQLSTIELLRQISVGAEKRGTPDWPTNWYKRWELLVQSMGGMLPGHPLMGMERLPRPMPVGSNSQHLASGVPVGEYREVDIIDQDSDSDMGDDDGSGSETSHKEFTNELLFQWREASKAAAAAGAAERPGFVRRAGFLIESGNIDADDGSDDSTEDEMDIEDEDGDDDEEDEYAMNRSKGAAARRATAPSPSPPPEAKHTPFMLASGIEPFCW